MDFGWIKKLFKIKSSANNSSDVGISTIDTSFIKVPKLSDLSKENQDKVMEYFNEIKYENYETIVKYSDSLLEKSNKEIDFFVHDLEDIIKDISSIIEEINKYTYFKLLLYREEIKQSTEELNKIEQEAELRLIALDTYIKKEERRKYDFLGIFGKAERLRYLSDKSSLLNERQRLLITIKLNKQHLQIIYNALNENKELLEQMELYFANSNSFNTMYCDTRFSMVYAGELLRLKRLINKNDCYELEQLVKNSETYSRIIITRRLSGIGIEEFDRIHESLKYQEVIYLLAHEDREIKQYAYEHRNDYKKIISELNDIVKRYEKMPSTDWDIKVLEKNIDKYEALIDIYRIVCKKYITDDILISMVESLLNLNYFVYCLSNKFVSNGLYGYKTISKIELLYNEYWDLDIEDMIVKDSEIKYYYQRALELFKQIENKYGVKLDFLLVNQFNKDKERLQNIDFFRLKSELKYLNDILNGNFEVFDLYIRLKKPIIKNETNDDLKEFIQRISSSSSNLINHLSFEKNVIDIHLDDLFHILKFLHIEKYNLSELFRDSNYNEKQKAFFGNRYEIKERVRLGTFKLNELLVKSYLRKLEKEYDDRILIIPRHMKGFTRTIHTAVENKVGVYVFNLPMAISINEFLKTNKEHSIKYLFINDNLYNELLKTNDTINAKVIIVPDDVKYNELSSYLDMEIEKGKNEEKVKSKKL